MTIPELTQTLNEAADDVILSAVFQRQYELSAKAAEMAEQLYRLRSAWIGGGTMNWAELSPGQRKGYVMEIEFLIRKGMR
jgi:hypothetical protein